MSTYTKQGTLLKEIIVCEARKISKNTINQ